jgi:hypothetical protein
VTPRLWVPPLLAAASILAIACGSSGDSAAASRTETIAKAGNGGATATAAERRGRRRPGCGRFCRQAGGFGGGPEPEKMPVRIASQTIRVARDRVIGVRATCRLNKKCVGAILINNLHFEYGRANLSIPAHKTRKVLVPVSRQGVRYLRRHGRDRGAFATVPLIYRHAALSISDRLTLLPPR